MLPVPVTLLEGKHKQLRLLLTINRLAWTLKLVPVLLLSPVTIVQRYTCNVNVNDNFPIVLALDTGNVNVIKKTPQITLLCSHRSVSC